MAMLVLLVISHNQMANASFLMFHSAFLAAADSLQDIRFNRGQWTTCLSSLLQGTAWPTARTGPRETESTNGLLGLLQFGVWCSYGHGYQL